MRCHICNTDNNISSCNHYEKSKEQQYPIEEYKRNIVIREAGRCYIPMFKYPELNWCFSLPIKTMYLQTIEEANKLIEKQKSDPVSKGCEYRIAKIVNF